MRTLLSWHNTFHNRKRALAATAGIAFAVLLMFMEAGFLDAARTNAALLYESMDFDAAIISRGYVSAQRTLPVNAFRILQARSVPGVAATIPLLVDGARWMNVAQRRGRSCQVIGVDPLQGPFTDPEIMTQLPQIRSSNTLLMDRLASRKYGDWQVGGKAIVNDTPLNIVGTYALGTGLISDGGIIVSQETFQGLTGRSRDQGYDLGLLRLEQGADLDTVMSAISATLPKDVLVLSRQALIEREQYFWVNLKPVGIMFKVGAVVAFIIGAVVLYQVLAMEISSRLNEFATLKAMGYDHRYLYRLGAEQALIFSVMAYIPAFLLALGLYQLVFSLSRLPMHMEFARAGSVLLLTLSMGAIAAVLALRKLRQADPAELF